MNEDRAKKLAARIVELDIARREALWDLQQEVFGGDRYWGQFEPSAMAHMKTVCKPENVQKWCEENAGKPIAEKGDVNAFEKICDAFAFEALDEDDITDELLSEMIDYLQDHFDGAEFLGTEGDPEGYDHLFVYHKPKG